MAASKFLFIPLAWIALSASAQRVPAIAWGGDYAAALETSAAEKKPVLVDFYADWCGPCRMMDEQVFTDPRVIKALSAFVPVKVDVDRNESVAYAYRIESIPRTIVLNTFGEIVGDRVGFLDADEYLKFLDDVKEFTHQKIEGTIVNVPASHAASVSISADTEPDALIELLGDRDPAVRKRALDEILGREAAEAQQTLERAITHEYLGVRIAAAQALRQRPSGLPADYDAWKGAEASAAVIDPPTDPEDAPEEAQ